MITKEMLRAFAPRPSATSKALIWDGYVDAIISQPELFAEAKINSDWRLAHLMAQWGHESGGFSILWESGAYSADQIIKIFGVGRHSARVTYAEAERIAALPVEERTRVLFERVYGLGNPKKAEELGNTSPGDGWKHRGWGIVQLTGRRDHDRLIGGDYSYESAIRVALIEWTEKGCNRWADADDCRRVTKAINGGYNGLDDRLRRLSRAKEVFAGALDDDEPVSNGSDHIETALHPAEPVAPIDPPRAPLAAPTVTVKDLAAMGSSKASLIIRVRNWAYTLLGLGAASTAADKAEVATVADLKGNVDVIRQAVDVAKVVATAAKDNILVVLVVLGIVAVYLASRLGSAMVRDFHEGRYEPPSKPSGGE